MSAFLEWLADRQRLSASTQNQALYALLLLRHSFATHLLEVNGHIRWICGAFMNGRMIAAFIMMLAMGAASDTSSLSQDAAGLLPKVDHLVYGTPDLRVAVERLEKLLGVRATPGGQHPGAGTRNALLALGPATYLEIFAPDPEQPKPDSPRLFGIDGLAAPRLVAWAAKGTDLDQLASDARRRGVKIGDVGSGNRRTPQGVLLSWQFTNPRTVIADGIVPFFIDWGQTPHPARTAAGGATLIEMRAEHPDPVPVQKILSQLGFDLPVRKGVKPALVAVIASARGRVELR